MSTELMEKLITTITELSPTVWNIFLKQVQVNIIQNWVYIFICTVLLILCIWITFFSIKKRKEYEFSDWILGIYLGSTVGIIFIILITIFFLNLISYYLNPNYYAIQLLLQNIK